MIAVFERDAMDARLELRERVTLSCMDSARVWTEARIPRGSRRARRGLAAGKCGSRNAGVHRVRLHVLHERSPRPEAPDSAAQLTALPDVTRSRRFVQPWRVLRRACFAAELALDRRACDREQDFTGAVATVHRMRRRHSRRRGACLPPCLRVAEVEKLRRASCGAANARPATGVAPQACSWSMSVLSASTASQVS